MHAFISRFIRANLLSILSTMTRLTTNSSKSAELSRQHFFIMILGHLPSKVHGRQIFRKLRRLLDLKHARARSGGGELMLLPPPRTGSSHRYFDFHRESHFSRAVN